MPTTGKTWKVKDTSRMNHKGTVGIPRPDVTKRFTGEGNPLWKGDKVNYRALHSWVERWLGKASSCSFCGKEGGRLHWANKDHLYKRNLIDWISLCPACHGYYDKQHNLRKHKKGE